MCCASKHYRWGDGQNENRVCMHADLPKLPAVVPALQLLFAEPEKEPEEGHEA